jgi:hypothetical protein
MVSVARCLTVVVASITSADTIVPRWTIATSPVVVERDVTLSVVARWLLRDETTFRAVHRVV